MLAQKNLLVGIILDIILHGDCICTAELRIPGALSSHVSFVMKFFIIHQNMGPVQWGNISCQKLTSQS